MSTRSAKSLLATVIGWLILGLLVFWLFGLVVGTIRFLVRFIVWIAVLALLLVAYFKLSDDEE